MKLKEDDFNPRKIKGYLHLIADNIESVKLSEEEKIDIVRTINSVLNAIEIETRKEGFDR